MSTHTFTSEEISKLSSSPFVQKCTTKSVTYTYDFKANALEQNKQGISPNEIWRRAGFDLSLWRKRYTKDCLKEWKKIVKEKGYQGLTIKRGQGATGRPKTKGVTDQDRIKRLELQVRYLKAENDFLVKLRARRAEQNSGQNRNTRSSSN